MMMKPKITFEANRHPDDNQAMGDGIMAYAKQKKGFTPLEFFAFFIRDDANKMFGGCNGNTLYGCLYLEQFWLEESLRHPVSSCIGKIWQRKRLHICNR